MTAREDLIREFYPKLCDFVEQIMEQGILEDQFNTLQIHCGHCTVYFGGAEIDRLRMKAKLFDKMCVIVREE